MKTNFHFLFFILLLSACASKQKVDSIIHHGKIYTVDSMFTIASTLVINDGKIVAIGGDSLLGKYEGSVMIDAKNNFIYPGFIDAHCHFTGQALDTCKLKLFGTSSFNEVIEKLVQFSKNNTRQWIEGTGWDQNDWVNNKTPTKDTLDQLFPNTPIFLMRVDGHSALVNQKALDLAHINSTTKIEGGYIELKNGKLTGIVNDEAMVKVQSIIPLLTDQESINAILQNQNKYFNVGLTSVVECGVTKEVALQCEEACKTKQLKLRTTLFLNANEAYISEFVKTPMKQTNQFHMAGFKIYADGSLGSRGAYLVEDYCDKVGDHGSMRISIDSLRSMASKIYESNYQLAVHAIGDKANHEVLNVFSNILPKGNDRRWRIEHAQVVQDSDMNIFQKFSIIPSVQPTHATSDMTWVEDRLGKNRMSNAYAYAELLKQNNWLPLGTDYPVENLNPIYTFYAAVFRMDKNQSPNGGFQIENALTREQALRGITIWAAKSVFEEDIKGSLEVGKLADFVMLDTDLMQANSTQIYKAKVLATYLNGENVFKIP